MHSRAKVKFRASVTKDASLPCQVTLQAQTFPLRCRERRKSHDGVLLRAVVSDVAVLKIHVRFSRAVTSFAANGQFMKDRVRVASGTQFGCDRSASMTTQAIVSNSAPKPSWIVDTIPRRQIPALLLRVPVQWRLEQQVSLSPQVGKSAASGTDDEIHLQRLGIDACTSGPPHYVAMGHDAILQADLIITGFSGNDRVREVCHIHTQVDRDLICCRHGPRHGVRQPLFGKFTMAFTAGCTTDKLIVVGSLPPGIGLWNWWAVGDIVCLETGAASLWIRLRGVTASGSQQQERQQEQQLTLTLYLPRVRSQLWGCPAVGTGSGMAICQLVGGTAGALRTGHGDRPTEKIPVWRHWPKVAGSHDDGVSLCLQAAGVHVSRMMR